MADDRDQVVDSVQEDLQRLRKENEILIFIINKLTTKRSTHEQQQLRQMHIQQQPCDHRHIMTTNINSAITSKRQRTDEHPDQFPASHNKTSQVLVKTDSKDNSLVSQVLPYNVEN